MFNAFGITREYCHRPSYDPDSFLATDELAKTSMSGLDPTVGTQCSRNAGNPPPWPWNNMTIWHLMSWKLTGSSEKSDGKLNHLVKTICIDNFKVEELQDFNAHI